MRLALSLSIALSIAAPAYAQSATAATLGLAIAKVCANESGFDSPADCDLIWQAIQNGATPPRDGRVLRAQLAWLRAHSRRVLGTRRCLRGNCLWSRNLRRSPLPTACLAASLLRRSRAMSPFSRRGRTAPARRGTTTHHRCLFAILRVEGATAQTPPMRPSRPGARARHPTGARTRAPTRSSRHPRHDGAPIGPPPGPRACTNARTEGVRRQDTGRRTVAHRDRSPTHRRRRGPNRRRRRRRREPQRQSPLASSARRMRSSSSGESTPRLPLCAPSAQEHVECSHVERWGSAVGATPVLAHTDDVRR